MTLENLVPRNNLKLTSLKLLQSKKQLQEPNSTQILFTLQGISFFKEGYLLTSHNNLAHTYRGRISRFLRDNKYFLARKCDLIPKNITSSQRASALHPNELSIFGGTCKLIRRNVLLKSKKTKNKKWFYLRRANVYSRQNFLS